jgi:Ser/Thr protein kinase RdoA (MazF antagonist)
VFCHGDPGPWNFVWRDQEAVGLIDWDYLHPAPRLHDVAYALQWFGPLRRDEFVLDWHHFPVIPNRRDRVRAFIDAYGGLPPLRRVRSSHGRDAGHCRSDAQPCAGGSGGNVPG